MTTRQEIKNELAKIKTDLYDQSTPPKMIGMDQFSSFLDNNQPLISNQDLVKAAKTQGVPLTEKTISQVQVTAQGGHAPAPDLTLTDPKRDQMPVNRLAMFVAENLAARTDPEASHGAPYAMFHDMELPRNTYKLYMQVNDRRLQGAYITDALKNTEESDSGHVDTVFLVSKNEKKSILNWRDHAEKNIARLTQVRHKKGVAYQIAKTAAEAEQILVASEATFRKSAVIFAQECHIIKPQHLVTFGESAANILRQMKPLFAEDPLMLDLIDNLVTVTHYSFVNKGGYEAWAETALADLREKLQLSAADNLPFK